MIWELIVIALSSFTPLLWLNAQEVILGNDSGGRIDAIQHIVNLFYSWNPTLSFGYNWSVNKGLLMVKMPEILFHTLTGSLHSGQQLMFVFWFFLIGASMFFALRSLYPSSKFWALRLWCSLLWMYNFYILQGWINIDRSKFSLFCALPLLFSLVTRVSQGNISGIRAAMLAALILFFFNGGGSVPLFGALIITLGTTIVTLFWIQKNTRIRGQLILFVFTTLILSVLTNAWWILPLAHTTITGYTAQLSAHGGTAGILAWEATVSTSTSYFNLLRLQGVPGLLGETNFLGKLASFIPITLIALLLLDWKHVSKNHKKSEIVLPLLLLIPIGLIFAAGTHPPLGFIYRFMIEHIPGFAIFRSSFFKFAPALWFPIIVLSGISFQHLLFRIQNKKLRLFLACILLIGIFPYHSKYFDSKFFAFAPQFSTKVIVPEYVPQMLASIKSKTAQTDRILLLPPLDNKFLSNSYTWGYWSIALLPNFGAARSIVANEKNAPMLISDIYRAFETGDTQKITALARITGITHVLWQDDIRYTDGVTTSMHFAPYLNTLLSLPDTQHVATHGAWRLYKVAQSTAHQVQTFSTVDIFTSLQPSIADIGQNPQNSVIISHDQPPLPITREIIEATCHGCDPYERESIKNLSLPNLKIFPDFPLYQLVIAKENRTSQAMRQNRASMVDLHIGFMGKRIAELAYLTSSSSKNYAHIEDTTSRLLDNVGAIADLVTELSGQTQINYANRAWDFLTFYQNQLASLALSQSISEPIQNKLKQTYATLDAFRYTAEPNTLRYTFALPRTDSYMLHLEYRPADSTLLINGHEHDTTYPILLSAGVQKVTLILSDNTIQEEPPRLYSISSKNIETHTAPRIVYHRTSPTSIEGEVSASSEPYIITFGDAFDEGWTIETTPNTTTRHIQVNGYANGWIVPSGPARSIRIIYWPQNLTIIGIMVSGISVVFLPWQLGYIHLLLDRIKKNRYRSNI